MPMTEYDLENLLARAARRVRGGRALRAALVALGGGLLAGAGVIFWTRLNAGGPALVGLGVAIAPLGALAALLAVYIRHRPSPRQVALLMDRQARTDEHLVTWLELRGLPESGLSNMERSFRAAQRAATLQRSASLNPATLLPIRLPAWSRSVWLAGVVLCCALLMPEVPAAKPESARGRDEVRRVTLRAGGAEAGGGGASNRLNETPRVQPLSPTQMMKLQMNATDPRAHIRAEALKELRAKVGGVPLSALPPELRAMLEDLEKDAAVLALQTGADVPKAGSAQQIGNPADVPSTPRPLQAVRTPEMIEKAFTAVRENFPDVEEELARYYGAKIGKSTGP